MVQSSVVERRGGKEPFQVDKYLEQKLGIKNERIQGKRGVAWEATGVPLRQD